MKSQNRRNPRIEFRPMLHATELKGVGRRSNHLQVMVAFQQRAECTIERFVEAPNGWMMLASIPGRPNTGGIYLYDDRSKMIWWLVLAGRDEDISSSEFDNLVTATTAQARPRIMPAAVNAKPTFVSHRNHRGGRNRHRTHNLGHMPQGIVQPIVIQPALLV